ncbi:cupin [Hyphomicrobium methylovorum]|uniref:cupin domain-containing protein n=1 Tax=Hyphomicrobium methylovorum TaxID=84 RepID=UPI0015E65B9C|nr:cupin [Hyphomicrobium methylovorum]
MPEAEPPLAITAENAPLRTIPSNYREPFFSRMGMREKRPLGDIFGLRNFGVNLTTLLPGGESALLHRHSKQDEFVYILEGTPTLVTDAGEVEFAPRMCAGFAAGGVAHHLVNRSTGPVIYLEVGDRTPGDEGSYPNDDIKAALGADNTWDFTHKDGRLRLASQRGMRPSAFSAGRQPKQQRRRSLSPR